MGFSIEGWMREYIAAVQDLFGRRVRFIGLQGSFARGEAGPGSDIDAVLILDRVEAADLTAYSGLLDRLPERGRSCGFVSGWAELSHWDPAELVQFYYDTVPYVGSLAPLLPLLSQEAAGRAVYTAACGIYHAAAHNLVHDHSPEAVAGLFKSARFALQAEGFRQTGRYIRDVDELAAAMPEGDRAVLEEALRVRKYGVKPRELEALSEMLLRWASGKICGG